MIFSLLIVLGLLALLFPSIRQRLKGSAAVLAAAILLFLVIASIANGW